MAITAAGIIFSSLNNNTLSRLTYDRTVAAIPFASRYRLVDFCLSSMVNSNISNISIVSNYNYRSLVEHIGSGKDWDLARREGGITFISPFHTVRTTPHAVFSTHMEALLDMQEYINEFKEEYVVLMDSDNVLNIDLTDVIKSHVESNALVTMVTKVISVDYTSKTTRMMVSSKEGRVTNMSMNDCFNPENPELCLGIYVLSTEELKKMISKASAYYSQRSFTGMLRDGYKESNYRTYLFDGFVASVSSFLDYYKCSIRLATDQAARESLLWKKESPVFTRIHNSSPAVHSSTSSVKNSMLGDECIIEGTVENSVLFRGVHVEKGAVVRNSILFRGTRISKGAEVNCIVTDKDVVVSDGVKLSGNPNMPFYVQKNRKV